MTSSQAVFSRYELGRSLAKSELPPATSRIPYGFERRFLAERNTQMIRDLGIAICLMVHSEMVRNTVDSRQTRDRAQSELFSGEIGKLLLP